MNTNERLPDIYEDEIDLWAYLGVLWKRKALILSITLLCAISAAVISFLLPKSYRSELILKIGSVGNMGTGSMASASINNVNNVEALIKSNPFLATVTQKNSFKPDDLRIETAIEKEDVNRCLETTDSVDLFQTQRLRAGQFSVISTDGFVKSPFAALRGILRHCGVAPTTPHSSGFARLATGAFYCAVLILTFYEIISNKYAKSLS